VALILLLALVREAFKCTGWMMSSEAEISALNQIGFASQFVDPDVETVVRTFHQHCFSCAGSTLENRVSTPYLTLEDLMSAEAKETRFSHISKILDGSSIPSQSTISRWPSMTSGRPSPIPFQTIASIMGSAVGSDGIGRRPYPSGGALYSAEMVLVFGDTIEGVPAFSVGHYLPVTNRFELLPGRFDRAKFDAISSIKGVSFYIAYFVNLKKATFKYRSRGYRLALLEIGSIYQKIIGAAQEDGLASRVLAGFSEYEFTKDCGLDSRLLLPAVIHAFGYQEGAYV